MIKVRVIFAVIKITAVDGLYCSYPGKEIGEVNGRLLYL